MGFEIPEDHHGGLPQKHTDDCAIYYGRPCDCIAHPVRSVPKYEDLPPTDVSGETRRQGIYSPVRHGEQGVIDQPLCTLGAGHEGACDGHPRDVCELTIRARGLFTDAAKPHRPNPVGFDVCGPQPVEEEVVHVSGGDSLMRSGSGAIWKNGKAANKQAEFEDGLAAAVQRAKDHDAKVKVSFTLDKPAEDAQLAEIAKRANNEDAGPGSKPSNPKDAVGSRKARWFSYLPLRVLVGVGLAMFEGARKYGRHNYRIAGVRASVYVDACVSGHLTPWMEGEDIDAESGLNHIDKAISTLMVLRDGMYEGNWVDDRAPAVKNWKEFMDDAHKRAVEIIERHPVAKDAFTIQDKRP